MLQELQKKYPGQYPDKLLRTLQRRVAAWRQEVILEFDDHLLQEDAGLTASSPVLLRAVPMSTPNGLSGALPENGARQPQQKTSGQKVDTQVLTSVDA